MVDFLRRFFTALARVFTAPFEQPERKLPEEARDELRTVLDSYDRMTKTSTVKNEGADCEARILRERLQTDPQSLWWSDLAQAELCVGDILDRDQLRGRIGGWRRRLGDVIGAVRYAQYAAAAPNLDDAGTTDSQLRADFAECVRGVYYYYGAYGIAAKSRSGVAKEMLKVAGAILLIEAVLAVLFAWHPWVKDWWTASCPFHGSDPCSLYNVFVYMLATSAAAVLGSIISVQRRLQDPTVDVDPFYRYIQTKADRFGVAFVSPVFGAIFGLLMYGLGASKLLGATLVTFDGDARPAKAVDVAVLLVLGFLAGFAEQLVPNALTRIAARTLGTVPGAPLADGQQPPAPPKKSTPEGQ